MVEKDTLGQALKLAQAGFYVFPCAGKNPAVGKGESWKEKSTRDEDDIRQMWRNKPGLVGAIDLGKSGHIIIDCDVKNTDEEGRHGNDNFAALCEANNFDFTTVPVVGTPSGGTHFYFRQRSGEARTNRTGDLPFGIDVRGDGGYVIAPNMVMSDGREYEFQGEIEDLINAPVLPDWLAQVLGEEKREEDKEHTPPVVPTPVVTDGTHLSNIAWKGIGEELAIIVAAPKGGRNTTLNTSAFAIATMVASGWVGEEEVRPLIFNAARQTGLPAPEINQTINSAFKGAKNKPRAMPDQVLQAEETEQKRLEISNVIYLSFKRKQRSHEGGKSYLEREDGELIDEDTGEIVTFEPEPQTESVQEMHMLEYPQGLVGEIARWIVATSRYPQPELAIGAALTIVGTASGRQFASPTKSATHLYTLGLAPTGRGKDHPLKSIKRVFDGAGLGNLSGAPDFFSMSAIYGHLMESPLSVCAMDEFGDFMRKVTSKKSSSQETQIGKTLRMLWSASFDTIGTPARAQDKSKDIVWPCLSIYGVSTPHQFYSALKEAALESGTLNRFLAIDGRKGVRQREPEITSDQVPQEIIEGLKRIYNNPGEVEMTWRSAWDAKLNREEHMKMLNWCPDGSQELFHQFAEEIATMLEEHPQKDVFYGRAAEMALRIATIIAIGRGHDHIQLDDLEYGIRMAKQSGKVLEEGATDYMAENENQANAQKIIRTLKAHKGRMKHRELMHHLGSSIRTPDLKYLLINMIEAGRLTREEVRAKAQGQPSVYYRLMS